MTYRAMVVMCWLFLERVVKPNFFYEISKRVQFEKKNLEKGVAGNQNPGADCSFLLAECPLNVHFLRDKNVEIKLTFRGLPL